MKKVEQKNFKSPDEVREFEKGKVEVLNFDGASVGLFKLEPGWNWAKHVKPQAKTEHCETPHFQYVISGRLRIKMVDGTEFDAEKGDVLHIPPGHDAWVLGDERYVGFEWAGASHYAMKK